jgi:Tfp pilus assembly protein PilO
MKSSTKRILSISISTLLFIGSLFVYGSLIKPAYSQIKDLRSEVASRLDFIEKNEAYIQKIQKKIKELQDLDKTTETISLILPLNQDVASRVSQIDGLAYNNRLTIELLSIQELSIKPSKQPNLVKGIGTLRFNFKASGNYENFKSFIQALETNITLMDLVGLKIEPNNKPKTAGSNFDYTMVVDTYYQAE